MILPACAAAVIGLAGCEDPSADLQVRLTHAQMEMDSANAEIQKLRAEKDKPAEQPAAAVRPVASDESFREAAKSFAAQLTGELKGATISAPAYSEVKTVATFHFMLTMPDGSVNGQDVVASVTLDGHWVFPAAGEIARGLAASASRQQANAAQAAQAAAAPPPQQQQQQPAVNPPVAGGPGLPANETRNIDFGDRPRPAGARPGPPATGRTQPAAPPANQQPTRAPSPALPRANEEVPVSFEKKK